MKVKKHSEKSVLYYKNGEYIGYMTGSRGNWELFLPSSKVVGSHVSHGKFKTHKAAYDYAIKL